MANIVINNYCNTKCPYCYIDNLKDWKVKTMSIEDYCTLLSWLADSQEDDIRISGGEPTLHPQFDNILKETDKYCRNVGASCLLYTNGSNLKMYLPYCTDKISIVLNWVEDLDQTEIIQILAEQGFFDGGDAILKCPLHIGQKRYKSFWDIISKYNIKQVTSCITVPYADYARYKYDKERYFTLMKPIFLQFCKDAINNNCEITMTCPQIPLCYFTTEEKEILNQACDVDSLDTNICLPVVDINADFQASICLIASTQMVDIRQFYSLADLERYLLFKHTLPCIEGNCSGRCTSCKEYELYQCQGGCLGFGDI